MDRDFLNDYYKREQELFNYELNKSKKGEFTYPPKKRFIKLMEPIGKSVGMNEIWSQIPFYGSTVIPLFPRNDKKEFEFIHGFNISDIPRIVDYAKDTGKIQFTLTTNALNYLGLDFLDPIFKEIKPPCYLSPSMSNWYGEDFVNQARIEFYTIAEINFIEQLHEIYKYSSLPIDYLNKRLNDFASDYIILKANGYSEIIEDLNEAMLSDFEWALNLFNSFGNFIAVPLHQTMDMVLTIDRELFNIASSEFRKYDKNQVIHSIGYDIGKILMNKLTLYPTSFEASKDVISAYNQEDLYSLLNSINIGIKEKEIDLINSSTADLSLVIDNIWDDAKNIGDNINYIRTGLPISLGLIGTLAAGPIGGVGGLLAGLGLNAVEKILEIKTDAISETLIKKVSPNYLVTIYDFKKKYQARNID